MRVGVSVLMGAISISYQLDQLFFGSFKKTLQMNHYIILNSAQINSPRVEPAGSLR